MSLSADALRIIADLIDAEPTEEAKQGLRRALARSLLPGPIERNNR